MTISGKDQSMKNIVKKALSLTFAVILALGAALEAGAAGSYFGSEGFSYGIDNGEAYVHGYSGEDSEVIIREKFSKYYVTAVEEYAFLNNNTMKALSFYDATRLRSLGSFAFTQCVSLERVDITSTIQQMGTGVFLGCTSLGYVRFREGALTDIPAQTFYNCESLDTVVFENGITSIGNYAFGNCASLKTIIIPDSVTSIADTAFSGCEDLVIACGYKSYAMNYAIQNNISYRLTDAVTYVIGDADGSGAVGLRDATTIQMLLAGRNVDDPDGIELRGDVDGNGLNINDVTNLQLWLLGLNKSLPIGESKTVEKI